MLATVLLVVHLMIAAGLVGVVLLQRSEGGALGIGGSGGGGGGFLTGRGTANMLTRITAALAAAFFTTSLLLSILAQGNNSSTPLVGTGAAPGTSAPATIPVVPTVPLPPASGDNTPASNQPRGGVLDKLQGGAPSAPASK